MHSDGRLLAFLYGTRAGRLLLRPLTARGLSKAAGRLLDSGVSCCLISGFARKNGIDLSEYVPETYQSFNAFFTRRILPEKRPIDRTPSHLIAPCDGRLSVYEIGPESVFAIKNSRYDVAALLGHDARAACFAGGICLVFRLAVDDYHRYHYFDSGRKGENHFIPGCLHTVRPVALKHEKVFVQNCREYTFLETEHFGMAAQIEVGALLVGRIRNRQGAGSYRRGEEKGCFEYGGSTVVLLLEKGRAQVEERFWRNTEKGLETRVLLGECIGRGMELTRGPKQDKIIG